MTIDKLLDREVIMNIRFWAELNGYIAETLSGNTITINPVDYEVIKKVSYCGLPVYASKCMPFEKQIISEREALTDSERMWKELRRLNRENRHKKEK